MYVYIYIYRERERRVCIYVYIHIQLFICTHMCILYIYIYMYCCSCLGDRVFPGKLRTPWGGEVKLGATSGVSCQTRAKQRQRRRGATWYYIGHFVRDMQSTKRNTSPPQGVPGNAGIDMGAGRSDRQKALQTEQPAS